MATQHAAAAALAKEINQETPVRDATTIANTVQLLRAMSAWELLFDANTLILRPANLTSTPSEATARRLCTLVKEAQEAAYAVACSSVLVGQGNESDDTSDVAFWLGEGDYAKADNVIGALGLSGDISEAEGSNSMAAEVESMEGKYRIVMQNAIDSRVVILEVGRMEGGWGGLVGLGVWT